MKPLLGILALTVAVSACGGSSSAAKGSSTTTSSTPATASRTAFRQCMAGHGITMPTRSPTSTTSGSQPTNNGGGGFGGGGGGGRFLQPPPGVDPTVYQSALSACRSLLPTGGAGSAQFRTAMIAYVNCLKSHGVQTGDPSQGAQALAGVDRTSPTFTAAAQVCRALLPQRTNATTSTTAAG